MTDFYEGQQVEVPEPLRWRKAKIITVVECRGEVPWQYLVEFPNGLRAHFDAAHIRAVVDDD
jgi:hypothetical protein